MTKVETMSDSLHAALAALPHGPEFRFVDALVSLEGGRRAVGRYTLPAKAAFLAGHFPRRPLLPGVIMIEALAQLAGVVAQTDPEQPVLADLRLTAVRQCKILGSIGPGETLRLEVEILGRMGPLIQAGGRVLKEDGTVLAEAQVTLSGTMAAPVTRE